MLKRDITYVNFNDEKVTETFYFNLTKTELIELNVSRQGGLEAYIRRIFNAGDNETILAEFKRIILLSIGERSDDGRQFIKNQAIREKFEQTAAYDALFMEMLSDDDAAANFIKGVIPADLRDQAEREMALPQPNIQPAENLRQDTGAPATPADLMPPPVPVETSSDGTS
jgi:uncharacterized protein YqfA (UPF0365 family)